MKKPEYIIDLHDRINKTIDDYLKYDMYVDYLLNEYKILNIKYCDKKERFIFASYCDIKKELIKEGNYYLLFHLLNLENIRKILNCQNWTYFRNTIFYQLLKENITVIKWKLEVINRLLNINYFKIHEKEYIYEYKITKDLTVRL